MPPVLNPAVNGGAPFLVVQSASNLTALVTPSFTPSTGDIIVVKASTADGSTTWGTPTGGGWAYTSRVNIGTASASCRVAIWTAPVATGGTAQTVSLTPAGNSNWHSMIVEVWSGAQLAGSPAVASTNAGSGSPSQALVTVAAGSVVSWLNGDWSAKAPGSRTFNTTSATPTDEGVHDGSTTQYVAYYCYQSAASAGSQTFGITAPGSQTFSIAGIEIQASAAAAAPAPPALPLAPGPTWRRRFRHRQEPWLPGIPDVATPIAATDTATLTEGTSAIDATLATTDAGALTEGASVLAGTPAATDQATLAEAVTVQVLQTAVDSAALTEGASVLAGTPAAVDSATLVEGTSAVAATPSASDVATLTEGASVLAGTPVAVDTGTLTEGVAVVQVGQVATDTGTLTEGASAIAATVAAVDTGTLSEGSPAQATAVLSVTDQAALSELAGPIALASVETGTLAEAVGPVALATTDAFALSEAVASSATPVATDSATLSDASSVNAGGTISFIGTAGGSTATTGATSSFVVPAGVAVGDLMLATVTRSATDATITSAPTGWTLEDGPTDKGTVIREYLYSRVADAGDLGATMTWTWSLSNTSRRHVEMAAYRNAQLGTGGEAPAVAVETTAGTTHVTPTRTVVSSGAWLVETAVDRGSPGSTDLTAPSGFSERDQEVTAGGGGMCTSIADSNGVVATGTRGGDTWTGTLSTANAITRTIVLVPTSGGTANISGTDSASLSEGAAQITTATAVADALALLEAAGQIAATVAATDAATFTDASAVTQTNTKAASDSAVLSEAASVTPFVPPTAGLDSIDDLMFVWFTARAPGETTADAMLAYFSARSGLPVRRSLTDHMAAYYAAALSVPNPEDVPFTTLEIAFWQAVDPTNNTGSWAVRAQKFYGS